MNYAKIGPVSEGSRLTRDLIENFSYSLKRLAKDNIADRGDRPADCEMFERHLRAVDDADKLLEKEDWDNDQHDDAQGMIDELEQALQEYAPPYVRFGEVPDERDCWGFYPDMGSLNGDAHGRDASVLKINASVEWAPDELAEGVEFVAEITDHGNVTLYGRDGVELWSCV